MLDIAIFHVVAARKQFFLNNTKTTSFDENILNCANKIIHFAKTGTTTTKNK